MRKLLVTGAGGFVGQHVRDACALRGRFEGWMFCPPPTGMDIRDANAVSNWVSSSSADAVLHLAAQSFVPRSFEDPRETFEINIIGTLNLLQALRRYGFKGPMLYISSGDIYGQVPDDALPVTEARSPEPRSPYAVSKLAAEQLCLQWHRTEGLHVTVARPFNHIGPGQDARFVIPTLARQIVAIKAGRQPPVIEAGDIDTTRDFTDVRDVVSAYAAILDKGFPGQIYLIGSGKERSVRDILREMCHLEDINPRIHQDPEKMRPAEQRRMVADATRLHRDTGWQPAIPFQQTLKDILNDLGVH